MAYEKVLVWGTGGLAEEILLNKLDCEIIGFVQTNRDKTQYHGRQVYQIDEIPEDYDYIL